MNNFPPHNENTDHSNINFIRQNLSNLLKVAEGENAQMLAYLIEMAMHEAVDLQKKSRQGRLR